MAAAAAAIAVAVDADAKEYEDMKTSLVCVEAILAGQCEECEKPGTVACTRCGVGRVCGIDHIGMCPNVESCTRLRQLRVGPALPEAPGQCDRPSDTARVIYDLKARGVYNPNEHAASWMVDGIFDNPERVAAIVLAGGVNWSAIKRPEIEWSGDAAPLLQRIVCRAWAPLSNSTLRATLPLIAMMRALPTDLLHGCPVEPMALGSRSHTPLQGIVDACVHGAGPVRYAIAERYGVDSNGLDLAGVVDWLFDVYPRRMPAVYARRVDGIVKFLLALIDGAIAYHARRRALIPATGAGAVLPPELITLVLGYSDYPLRRPTVPSR